MNFQTLQIALSSLLVLNAIIIVIFFIGWLTHATYYYKIIDKLDEIIIFIHGLISSVLLPMAAMSFLFDDSSARNAYTAVSLIHGGYFFIAIVLFLLNYLVNAITKVRAYFGHKRGRE